MGGVINIILKRAYDGAVTQLRYTTAPGGYWYSGWPAWGHGASLCSARIAQAP